MGRGNEFLCGIGVTTVEKHEVGVWDGTAFEFANGSYSPTRLYKKADNAKSGNSVCVQTFRKINP